MKYIDRLNYLRYEAEDDGITINTESEKELLALVEKFPDVSIVLTDDGTFKGKWGKKIRGTKRSSLVREWSFEFLGNGKVRFVNHDVLFEAGRCSLKAAEELLEELYEL